MSDSENQGAWYEWTAMCGIPHFARPRVNRRTDQSADEDLTLDYLTDLEATITTLKAQLKAAEGKAEALWQVYNAAWHLADNTEEDHPDGPSSLLEDFVELDRQMRALEVAYPELEHGYDPMFPHALSAPASDTGSEEENDG